MPANKWLKRGALGAGGAGLGAGGFYLGRQQGRHDEAKHSLEDARRNLKLQHSIKGSALRSLQDSDTEIEGLRRKASRQARKPGNAYWATSTKLDDAYMQQDLFRRQAQHQGGRATEAAAQKFYNETRERKTRPFWANQGLSKGYPIPGGDYPDTDKDFDYPGRKARREQMKAKRKAAQAKHMQSGHSKGERDWLKQQAIARKGLHLARRDGVKSFAAAMQEKRAMRRGEGYKPDTVLDSLHRQPKAQVRKAFDERQQRQAGIALGGAGLLGTGVGATRWSNANRRQGQLERNVSTANARHAAAEQHAQERMKMIDDFDAANKTANEARTKARSEWQAKNPGAKQLPGDLRNIYAPHAMHDELRRSRDKLKSAAGRAEHASKELASEVGGLKRMRRGGKIATGLGVPAALGGAALYAHANHEWNRNHAVPPGNKSHGVRKDDRAHAFDVDVESRIHNERARNAAHQAKSQSLYGLPPEAADKLDPRTKRFLANRATYGMSEPGIKNKARSAGTIGGGLLAGSVAGRFAGNLATMKLKNKRVRSALATGAATIGGGLGTSIGARKAVQMNDKIAAREHAQQDAFGKAEAQTQGEKGYKYASPFRRNWSTPRQQRQEIRRPTRRQAYELGGGAAAAGSAGLAGSLLYHRSAGKSWDKGNQAKQEAEAYIANARQPYNEYRAKQLKRTGSTGSTKYGEHIRQAGEKLINPPRGAKNPEMFPLPRIRSAEKQMARAERRMARAGKVGLGTAALTGAAGYALLQRNKNRVKAQQMAHAQKAVSDRRNKAAAVAKAEDRRQKAYQLGAAGALGAGGLTATGGGLAAYKAAHHAARQQHHQSRQAFHALKPSLETVKLEPLELDKVKLAGGEHFETKVAQHGRKAAAHGLKRGRATKAAVGLGLGTAGAAATSAYLANKSRKANSLSKQLDGPWGSGAVMGRGD